MVNQKVELATQDFRRTMEQALSRLENSVAASPEPPKAPHGVRFSQKNFEESHALLSKMFQIPDYKALYNMCIASMLLITVSILFESSEEHLYGFAVVFADWQEVAICWVCMALLSFLPVLLLRALVWLPRSLWAYLPLLTAFEVVLFGLPTGLITGSESIGFGSKMILMCEATRMSMKVYAYIRTKLLYCTDNRYKAWSWEGGRLPEDFQIEIANLQTELRRFTYFFFAPTLIYRDRYKLTRQRSLLVVAGHLFNFLASIFYSYMVYSLMCVDTIKRLSSQKVTLKGYVSGILRMVFPSMVFFIMGFFGFLHSWQNAWAELLWFPDRQFYYDWWNSSDIGAYYRKWNNVVHDFLFYYVYSDGLRFWGCSKSIAQLSTFLLSAVMHEVIINLSIGIFYPFLFILFAGPGILLYFWQKNGRGFFLAQNVVFWLQMYIGFSWCITSYLAEMVSRTHVPKELVQQDYGALEPIIPRFILY